MADPRFSILIPTRDRPATFRHTLATVASQPGDDYEIVIADNCSSPETRKIVEELASPKIRYLRSDEVLPMAENWERGLSQCSGEYVTVLGDDDGFLPTTLAMARKLVAATEAEMICWSTHVYWWPDTIIPWYRNGLIVRLGNSMTLVESRPILRQIYDGTLGVSSLPMIYSGFHHRGLIDEARRRYDGFFVPRETSPDISSGILGLYLTENYVLSTRPLSIRGNSGNSIGTAHWARSLGAELRKRYYRDERYRDERVGLEGVNHRSLIPSPNSIVGIASAMLKCKELFFPNDDALSVDPLNVLQSLIASLDSEPEAYEDNLNDALALAAKLGVSVDPAQIPAKPPSDNKFKSYVWGPTIGPSCDSSKLDVNGNLAGLQHIGDAARLIEALLPPLETFPQQL